MISEQQAILDRIAAYDHLRRPDVQALAKLAFKKRLEAVILAWMLQLQQPQLDPMHVHEDNLLMRSSLVPVETVYTQAMEKLQFQVIPAEIKEDVEAAGATDHVRKQVDTAVARIVQSMLRQRVAQMNPALFLERRPVLSVHLETISGSVILVSRLWTESTRKESHCCFACCVDEGFL